MKTYAIGLGIAALTSTTALAGGLERNVNDFSVLFEEGNVLELNFRTVDPTVSSSAGGIPDSAPSYMSWGLGYKHQFNDQFALGVFVDEPWGADIHYEVGPFSGVFPPQPGRLPVDGQASVDSNVVTVLGRYEFGNGFSVHGGLRASKIRGFVVSSPGILNVSSDWSVGYVIGAAWEKPEIAARVALTYTSEIGHTMSGTEDIGFGSFAGNPLANYGLDITTPASVELDFQTGIAANTLLFGSIRWTHWDGFNVPSLNPTPGQENYVSYDRDDYAFNIGVGRKLNDNWSVAVFASYEKDKNQLVSALGPTDGNFSLGVGGSYTTGSTKISGGVRYVWLGDAVTASGNIPFNNNYAIGLGLSLTQTF